ncbi:MAG: LysE family translocator [Beijerinckiaceae bacterium]|nr:LysE family translocator [Beijerinckiaceae bacterium]
MSLEMFGALVVFAAVMSGTPGPNNMMLLASGVNFGFRRSIPHMLGISFGVMLLLLAIGFGLHEVLQRWPLIFTVIKYAGGAYLLWLAWMIANAGPLEDGTGETRGRPMRFLEALAFQWINPKAWVMAVGAMATYTNESAYTLTVIIVALVFGVVCGPATGTWTAFGVALKRFLQDPKANRLFNIAMALALVASLWPLVREWL